jgi:hypothetical protein
MNSLLKNVRATRTQGLHPPTFLASMPVKTPFDATSELLERHRVVVMACVDFLLEKFPQARGPTVQ